MQPEILSALGAIIGSPWFNALTFFSGLWIGHRLNLGMERRKEFNAAALPIREWLLKDMERPSVYLPRPSAIDMDTFLQCLSWRQRRSFRLMLELDTQTRQKQLRNDDGSPRYADPSAIQGVKRRMLPLTARR